MTVMDLTADARQYIKENGGTVTIRLLKGQAACCSTLTPVIECRTPPQAQGYSTLRQGGVTLYLQEGIEPLDGGVAISLNRFLWIKRLNVQGLNILP